MNFFKVSRGTVSGAVVTIATSTINKDEATSTSARELATVVLNSNYENLVVTVTMGGTTVNWFANGKVTIPANTTVTGDIKISASATAINTGGETDGEVTESTTWHLVKSNATASDGSVPSTTLKYDNGSVGLTWGSETDRELLRNKPINILRIISTYNSGTMRLGIFDAFGSTNDPVDILTGTISKINTDDSTSIVTLEKTITLTGEQVLVIEPSDRGTLYNRDYTFVYGYAASGDIWKEHGGFVTRAPKDLRTPNNPTPWSVSENACFPVDAGYKTN